MFKGTSLFGAAFAVALETNEIIDFGTKSKMNEVIAFSPMKKSSDKFKEHKAKVEENSEAVFEDSSGAMEKEICKVFFNRSKKIGLQYTDLVGDRDSKDYNEVKGIYGMCDECKKYEEKKEEDKEMFDTSKKGLQFWQKHRDKQIKCNRVNKIEYINHVDKRCGTTLRDLRDAWRGHKVPDGKAVGGKKNRLTEVDIKKLQVNYGKTIRSNVVPDVKTVKNHKDAVDKMKKAVMASLYHSIMLKDDKVRHLFCPSGDTSWCKFRRLGNMENAPHHLEPVFLDILEPLYTNRLASFELLSRCLPGVTQNVLDSINSILWQKVPKHKFHGTKTVHIGACSTAIYHN